MLDMPTDTPQHAATPKRSRGWRSLRILLILIGCALGPAFFADMFRNVRDLLLTGMGGWSWIVPAATEGSFLFLFLLDVLLLLARKPMGWLRWAPYGFAVCSVTMNVWAAHGNALLAVGNAAVTMAFFVPLVAAERAIRSMSVTDDDVRLAEEMKAAMRHAADLVRSEVGWRRWLAPSLLRIQIRHRRPPAAVTQAIASGAEAGGAVAWEETVEDWVTKSLTRNARIAAKVTAEKRAIAAASAAPAEAPVEQTPPRQPARQKGASDDAAERARKHAKAKRLLSATPRPTLAEVAEKTSLSERTLSRISSQLPPRLDDFRKEQQA